MPDYSQGKIYYIQSTKDNLIYIGSTTQKLNDRILQHKRDNANSQLILRYDDCDYGLIEDYPCKSNNELRWRERYWLEKCMNCFNVINEINPIRSEEEKQKYFKEWREKPSYKKRLNLFKKNKRVWKNTFGLFEGKTQGWNNNLLDIDITLFE
jgi:hypothetical protein